MKRMQRKTFAYFVDSIDVTLVTQYVGNLFTSNRRTPRSNSTVRSKLFLTSLFTCLGISLLLTGTLAGNLLC